MWYAIPFQSAMAMKCWNLQVIGAGTAIRVADTDLEVIETLDGYAGYLGIGNNGFTNGVQVIVDDSIYEQLTGIKIPIPSYCPR